MKRTALFLALIVLLSAALPLFGASFGTPTDGSASVSFLSENYREKELSSDDMHFWENSGIGLVTVGPGRRIYEWFGHSAVAVSCPGYDSISFNYGYFSFDEKYFSNFAIGRLLYRLDTSYTNAETWVYESENRVVSQVLLNLTPEKKKAVADFLLTNARPPADTYLYHYYRDNCATRVRDLLNFVSDGSFETWARSIKGHTFREWNSVVFGVNPFVQWIMDFLQGRSIDNKDASLWSEMYLPDRLLYAVEQYPGFETSSSYGSADEVHGFYEYRPKSVVLKALALSLVISAVLLLCFRCARGMFNALSFLVFLVLGLLGALLFFMMVFTTHDVTWGNENILIYSPLLLIISLLSLNSRKHCRALLKIWYSEGCVLALLVLLKLVLPGIMYQQNTAQILFLVPLVAVNILVYRKSVLKKA